MSTGVEKKGASLDADPCSVSAMLRGRGDGREKLYERFSAYWHDRHPEMGEDEIAEKYERYTCDVVFLMWRPFKLKGHLGMRWSLFALSLRMRLKGMPRTVW
jgi:hypothetical protein